MWKASEAERRGAGAIFSSTALKTRRVSTTEAVKWIGVGGVRRWALGQAAGRHAHRRRLAQPFGHQGGHGAALQGLFAHCPLTRGQMGEALKRLRRLTPEGPRDVVSVDKTIYHTMRNAGR